MGRKVLVVLSMACTVACAQAQAQTLSPEDLDRRTVQRRRMRHGNLDGMHRHGHEVRYARTRLGTDLTRAAD